MSDNEEISDPFKVYIKIRPLTEKENSVQKKNKSIVLVEDNLVFVLNPETQELYGKKEKNFHFDGVFSEKDTNKTVFEEVLKNQIDNLIIGFNSTVLAYGVTGTGKTHTIFGDIYSESNKEKGTTMYGIEYLFEKLNNNKEKRCKFIVSYLEIYNEQVVDLLTSKQTNLMIVEDPSKGIVVPELTEFNINTPSQILKLIIEGNSRRAMASTGMNKVSSRSHAIFQIILDQRSRINEVKEEQILSKFLLVDLAGSERGGLEKGMRTHEGSNINKSLLSLGNCINLLSDQSKKGCFVPYRDSKLTRLLKDSLGGNILTSMIACISPSRLFYEETINTLKYASRARKIKKKVERNIEEINNHISEYRDIIDNLKYEINQLKGVIKTQNQLLKSNAGIAYPQESSSLYAKKVSKDFLQVKSIEFNSEISKNNQFEKNFNSEIDTQFLLNEIEKIQSEKIEIEEKLKISKNETNLYEKLNSINNHYEKLIEIINNKLVDNLEQNMVFKINLNEIIDLNMSNNKNLTNLNSKLYLLEKMQLEKSLDTITGREDSEINKTKDEIKYILKAIEENEYMKEKISKELEKNLKEKKLLNKMLQIIANSNSTSKLNENNSEMRNVTALKFNNEQFNSIIKEKESKDNKLEEVQIEVENLRKLLKNKQEDKEKQKAEENENFSKKSKNSISKDKSKDDSDVENIEFNLQDDYFDKQREGKIVENIKQAESNRSFHSESTEKVSERLEIENKHEIQVQVAKINLQEELKKNNSVVPIKNKPSINIFINNSNIHNTNNTRNKPPSPRNNKFKEYDKIIESHLNQMYFKKAKALGDKMKKKLSKQSVPKEIKNKINLANTNLKQNNFDQNIMAKLNIKDINKEILSKNLELNQFHHSNNKSLSISAVTIHQENNFNSENEFVDHLIDVDIHKFNQRKLHTNDEVLNCYDNSYIRKADNPMKVNAIPKRSMKCQSTKTTNRVQSKSPTIQQRAQNKNDVKVQENKSQIKQSNRENNNRYSDNNIHNLKNKIEEKFNQNKVTIFSNKRDHSPNLQQARLEKKLQKQMTMDVPEENPKFKNELVSQKACEFVKEYSKGNLLVKTDYSVEKELNKFQNNDRFHTGLIKNNSNFKEVKVDDYKGQISQNMNVFTVKNITPIQNEGIVENDPVERNPNQFDFNFIIPPNRTKNALKFLKN